MLNKEIVPPDVDMRYESFFDNAKQETWSPLLALLRSLLINCKPLLGRQVTGETCVVAYMYFLFFLSTFNNQISNSDKERKNIEFSFFCFWCWGGGGGGISNKSEFHNSTHLAIQVEAVMWPFPKYMITI